LYYEYYGFSIHSIVGYESRKFKIDERFRPIALANFQFKMITKVLAVRLAIIAMRIISLHRRGFVRDQHISDCEIVAYEAINLLEKKQFIGYLAFPALEGCVRGILSPLFCFV